MTHTFPSLYRLLRRGPFLKGTVRKKSFYWQNPFPLYVKCSSITNGEIISNKIFFNDRMFRASLNLHFHIIQLLKCAKFKVKNIPFQPNLLFSCNFLTINIIKKGKKCYPLLLMQDSVAREAFFRSTGSLTSCMPRVRNILRAQSSEYFFLCFSLFSTLL
jgi:hypothetical protein